MPFHGLAKPLFPIHGCFDNVLARQMGDTLVTRLDQGLGGRVAPDNVSRDGRRVAHPALVAIEKHQRQSGKMVRNGNLSGDQRGIDGADGILRDQHVNGGALQLGAVARAEHGDGHILQGRLVTCPFQEWCQEWGRRDLIDEEADDALPSGRNRMGRAAPISQLIGSLLDAPARGLRDAGIGHAIEHQRNGSLGHAGQFRHVMHGCALFHIPSIATGHPLLMHKPRLLPAFRALEIA